MALESLTVRARVVVRSDSEYVVKAFTEGRLARWKQTPERWKKVKNPDLWSRLNQLTDFHVVTFEWVKGHADDELNNRVNNLAEGLVKKYYQEKSF
jgi:ribonuclease HI